MWKKPVCIVLLLMMLTVMPACSSSKDAGSDQQAAEEETVDQNEPNDASGEERDSSPDGQGDLEYRQAPMLDEANLPPVRDRLPLVPKVTNEMPAHLLDFEIGRYGGTLRTLTSVVEWDADVFVMNNEPLLNTPAILGDEVTGNVLLGYEVSPDQQQFTFYMREGLKWSDGQPVTSEDVRFAVEDVIFNEELTPVFPIWLRAGGVGEGKPVQFELIDTYTFRLSFDSPYGGLPIRLAIEGWRGYTDLLKPAHYLKAFHRKYADAGELEQKIKEAGFAPEDWVSLFHDKDIVNTELTHSKAIGFPVLYPWVFKEKTKTTAIFERNPYYFKVDPAGNQLPYIDRIESTLVQDIEMVTMKTIAGEADFVRESAALVKMPLYKENEDKGYFALLADMHVTPTNIFLNLTYDDPVWRQVVRDVRFRKALNLALDREEIIDSIYYGFADPSSIIDPAFDLEEANRLLDEMGMKKGPDGFRVGPDGKTFTIPFEVGAQAPDIVPLTELVVEMWKRLGLNVTMKTIDGSLWGTRNAANELKATVIWSPTPQWYRMDAYTKHWSPLWDRWWTSGGRQGEEPPDEVKQFYLTLNEMAVNPPEVGKQAIERAKQMMREQIWFFVPIENVKQPLIVNQKLGNVSDKGFAIATNFSGEQLFFKE
jgi:peptide/nickel transport system substrate-binding protein